MPTRNPKQEGKQSKGGRWRAWTSSLRTEVPRIQLPKVPRIGKVSVKSLQPSSTIGYVKQEPRRKSSGLFEDLLGGDPRQLLYDITDDEQKYDAIDDRDRLLDVLRSLSSGSLLAEDLTTEDRALLEFATLEFATAPATKQLEEGRKQLVVAAKKAVEKVIEPVPAPAKEDIPDTDMPPFWWL